MKRLLISLIISLITYSIYCQDTPRIKDTIVNNIRKNSVFFEAVGNGSFYSINYERLFTKDDNKGIGVRIGYTYMYVGLAFPEYYHLILGEVSFINGKKHCLDIGCGLTLVKHVTEYLGIKTERGKTFNIRTGYRYRGEKGLIIRIAPLLKIGYHVISYEETVWVSGGFSIGYSF